MNALERLRAVLCAPDGEVVIDGTDADRSIVAEALEELDAALSQTAGVPDGYVMVPARMELTPENMETLVFMLGGDPDAKDADERWSGGTLWVGETIGDNGEKYYGLNVANVECYEEGSVPIVEFAAAQAASGVHPDALPDGTLSKSTAKRVEVLAAASVGRMTTAEYTTGHCPNHNQPGGCQLHNLQCGWPNCDRRQVQHQPAAAASVSERARELLAAEYRTHGWHEDAGRLCMGGDVTSFVEDDALRVIARLIEEGDEDAHVITEMGRLLACIAVILKGPEPAGTAWSYHDLPELVASALSEPRQVAAEMKAWAHTKMAEQQSSRRDRMMVSEWAKRLLPESSFPIKDFDVEGMSITKEAAREAVKRVALEQALTQQRGECEDAHKFRRLAQILDGFDFRLGRNALMPPATYLDSVEITCEFQPGIGQSVIDAIVDVLATEKRND